MCISWELAAQGSELTDGDRYPGQENGDFKIPSIIWYKPDGTVRAAGAEARDPALEMAVEDEGLIFVEW